MRTQSPNTSSKRLAPLYSSAPREAGEAIHPHAPTHESAREPKVKARREKEGAKGFIDKYADMTVHRDLLWGHDWLQIPYRLGYSQEMALCRPLPQRPPPHLCQLCWGQGEAEAGLRLPAPGAHERSPPLQETGNVPRAESGGGGKGGRQQLLQTLSRKPE